MPACPTVDRRQFLRAGALSAGGIVLSPALSRGAPAVPARRPPNFLIILCDQLSLDAIAAHGCQDVRTPHLDRLISRGVTFLESHSTNPVCSPARSSIYTGRMPVETGVITNDRAINPSVPNLGQWFRKAGYETVYCGKWHLPHGRATANDGFRVLPAGIGQGDLMDNVVARQCEAYLTNRSHGQPFVLAANYLQPHDICYWAIKYRQLVPPDLPFPRLADVLPGLPPNNRSRPKAPRKLDRIKGPDFSDLQWRYYRYIYFRQVEMLDADVGRVLSALDASGEADNTIVLFTSDHGEGGGRHGHVQKWYPYEEGVKVPLIVSCPARLLSGHRDRKRLVSGLDIMSTLCDYAGIAPPPDCRGRSLRPLLEGGPTEWREFLVTEHHVVGRMVRTSRFKYVRYEGDPVVQLFDMKKDPWEMRNLAEEAAYADVVADHAKLLAEWQRRLKPVPPSPLASARKRG